ncbi:hypothetical protein Fmac_016326 [Flemingia macrophylla]|uniref:DRBM domain-containing protein n=1 Tax=Flemingia macrophylla TaxID=520843 RepID=A0ABD1MH24_9FABA
MLSSGATFIHMIVKKFQGHAGLYKNLLQELAQKEGFRLPRYTTDRFGEDHMPKFVSQVEVEGEVFSGQEAKSKKQAELSAAKVAYMALKAHKGKSDAKIITGLQQPANPQSPVSPGLGNLNQPNKDKEGTHEFSPDCSEANIITGLQHQANPKSLASPGLVNWNQPNKDEGKSDQRSFFPLSVYQVETQEISPDCSEAKFITGLQHPISTKSPACPGLVNWNQPCEDKGEFSKAQALIISTSFISSTVHQGDTHEFSPDRSEANIITGLQYQANPKSSASPGLVNWNQPNKDEVKNASCSSGSTNGSTEDSSLSIEKLTPSFSGSTKVDCESKTNYTNYETMRLRIRLQALEDKNRAIEAQVSIKKLPYGSSLLYFPA